MAKLLRTLQCGVTQEVYDSYRALLPPGASVDSHLRTLVEEWLTNPGRAELNEFIRDHAATETEVLAGATHAARLSGALPEPEPVEAIPVVTPLVGSSAVNPEVCHHPRGSHYREGHSIVCGVCGRDVTRVFAR